MQIPVIITDNRGYRSMIDWLQVEVVVENDKRDTVRLRFTADVDYSLWFQMSLDEFKKQVEEQLEAGLPEPSYITPSQVTITPLSNTAPDEPLDGVETS